jgi:hypothetical protein
MARAASNLPQNRSLRCLCAAFEAAEDDGLTGQLVDTDHPRTLDGGAAEPMTEITGRRILALVEVMQRGRRGMKGCFIKVP